MSLPGHSDWRRPVSLSQPSAERLPDAESHQYPQTVWQVPKHRCQYREDSDRTQVGLCVGAYPAWGILPFIAVLFREWDLVDDEPPSLSPLGSRVETRVRYAGIHPPDLYGQTGIRGWDPKRLQEAVLVAVFCLHEQTYRIPLVAKFLPVLKGQRPLYQLVRNAVLGEAVVRALLLLAPGARGADDMSRFGRIAA